MITSASVIESLRAAGFIPEPSDGDKLPGQTWLYRGTWRTGTHGRVGWPTSGVRVCVSHDIADGVSVHSFDATGGCTGSADLSGDASAHAAAVALAMKAAS